jgi:hypothetical protein
MRASGLHKPSTSDGLPLAQAHTPRRPLARRDAIGLFTFATTLFLSALLLFSVQPIYAKLILPKLGGAPSVWAVSMCFFQAVLLAGYFYAFALNRWVKDGRALFAHLGLMATCCWLLPFEVPSTFAVPPEGDAYLWLIELLVVGIGLPFFAVSANAPLLQAWFSRTHNACAADPYFLYGASNLGSLIALVSYPLVVEPAIGLAGQSKLWSLGFLALAAMIAISGTVALLNPKPMIAPDPGPRAPDGMTAPSIGWASRVTWIALAFIPSGLVVAVTTYITTDVASAPFLWVLPLALFLSTFVLVFRAELPFKYGLACDLLPAAMLGFVLTQGTLVSSVLALASFVLAAVICHRELYNRRPPSEHLTEFYLWMSVGGVLGGAFSALLAPHLFASVFEFTLLALLALLCRPGVLLGRSVPVNWCRLALIVATGLVLMAGFKLAVHFALLSTSRLYPFVLIGVLCLGLFAIRRWPEHRAALVLTMIAAFALTPSDHLTIHVQRTFFGTHRVVVSQDGSLRMLLHGTTVHGAIRLKDAAGRAVAAPVPATYYHPASAMARAVAVARASLAAHDRPLRAGIVGLGTGSLACYAAGGEEWRFYEIDPAVVRIATDPKLFDFLARCLPEPDIVIGDARLMLAKAPRAHFGYLVIDAFSSDSIPVHLLTAEALRLFLDKLDPDGLLALHVSNNHLDLVPALASTIARVPGLTAALVEDERRADDLDALPSRLVVIARSREAIAPVLQWRDAAPLVDSGARAWTDDYSDVLSAMIAHFVR